MGLVILPALHINLDLFFLQILQVSVRSNHILDQCILYSTGIEVSINVIEIFNNGSRHFLYLHLWGIIYVTHIISSFHNSKNDDDSPLSLNSVQYKRNTYVIGVKHFYI